MAKKVSRPNNVNMYVYYITSDFVEEVLRELHRQNPKNTRLLAAVREAVNTVNTKEFGESRGAVIDGDW